MASIRLEGINKTFGKNKALRNVNFQVEDGEFFCILGPPGAGKTTTLRIIIGLETPDEGKVYIDDEIVNSVHPSKRDLAMIFQNLALYPDKTIFENIASPLKRLKLDEQEINSKVVEVAKQLRIDWMLKKKPAQLSGGERQRVAIGRAIVRQPSAYLMDEPLSNLDSLLRLEMRLTLKELQTSLKETFIYATHDQVEALSMADRIAILDKGVLQQIGLPGEVYRYPENSLVATVLGNPSMNFIACRIKENKDKVCLIHEAFSAISDKDALSTDVLSSLNTGKDLMLGVRPEDITISLQKPTEPSVMGEIYVTEPLGNKTIVDVKLGEEIIKVIDGPSFKGEPAQTIWIRMNEAKLHLFETKSRKCVYHASEDYPVRIDG